jgi:hypothetical protein
MTHTLTLDSFLAAYAADRAAFTKDNRDAWNGRTRTDYRKRLVAWQGNICPACGETMGDLDLPLGHDERPEWNHMMTARRYCCPDLTCHNGTVCGDKGTRTRCGYRWGNVFQGHVKCNRANGERDLTTADLARPDLVFWGTTRDLPKV